MVPRYSRDKVDAVMRFYSGIALVLSTLGYNNALYAQALLEREHAARELRAGEEKYRQLYENMVHGVFYQNADGTLTDINPAGLEMFGLTRDQFLGRSSHHPEWKVVDEEFKLLEADNHPTMQCLREEKPVNRIVGVYNPKMADYRWLSVHARPLYHKGDKKPFQIVATMHDITRRKELENRLREMAGVVEAMPAGLFLWRYHAPDGLFLAGANPAALASTGLDFEMLRDQSFDL